MEIDTVILSLGSNLGNGAANIKQAISKLKQHPEIEIINISHFYTTEAWGYESIHPFTNNCIEIKTELSPFELLSITQEIEKEMGREKKTSYADRVIDMDIIFFKQKTISTDTLSVPHPYWNKRKFVLFPLFDLHKHLTIQNEHFNILDIINTLEKTDQTPIISLPF